MVNDSETFFHIIGTGSLPEGVSGLIGSLFLAQEKGELSFHHKTLTKQRNSIDPIRFSNVDKIRNSANSQGLVYTARIPNTHNENSLHNEIDYDDECNLNEHEDSQLSELDIPERPHTPLTEEQLLDLEEEDVCDLEIENRDPEERLDLIMNALKLKHLDEPSKDLVKEIVGMYADCFFIPGEPLGKTNAIQHTITVTDNNPVFVRQYPFVQLSDRAKETGFLRQQTLANGGRLQKIKRNHQG
ncbi:uncharacterized protein LOC113464275 [Ceratina calcarata]|uniref:Uncharacterized protein LOC113464275 n=1 Tax=Ceratina calcarata TaxID=156304 RepID=A0AAJ7S0A5_9HYME|nr:uncharacterized protein LOC113464275 [Ceratina calcarata]